MAAKSPNKEAGHPLLLVVVYPGIADWEVSFTLFCVHPGIQYRFASIGPKRIKTAMGFELEANLTLDAVSPRDFDGIFLPGGLDPDEGRFPRSLGENVALLELIRKFGREDKVIAAICGGPLVLGAAGLLKDKRFTCDVTEDTRGWFEGAMRSEDPLTVDGRTITASVRAMLPFSIELARLLGDENTAREIEEFFRV
jgi:4-methyl-5(b-hydroxyethyl)-thiazole monophosphate biosynthesis